jgi:hypothetical protein
VILEATRAPAGGWLRRQLTAPKQDFPKMIARIRSDPALIDSLMAGIDSKTPTVKFGSAKALWLLAAAEPRLLYPRFDFLVKQLDSANSIVRWNAARALACLAPVDAGNKLDGILDKYLSPIDGPEMIAAAMAIEGAATIALAKPRLAGRMVRAILRVREARYKTEECRNVAIGHAIQALGRFFELAGDRKAILGFVSQQLDNPRPATRKKAEAFLSKVAGSEGR